MRRSPWCLWLCVEKQAPSAKLLHVTTGAGTSEHRGWAIKIELRPGVTANGDMYVRDPSDGEVIRSIVHLKRKLGLEPPARRGDQPGLKI